MKNDTTQPEWKDDIANFFKKNIIFRYEFMTRNLVEAIKEWTEYLDRFDNIRTNFVLNLFDNDFNRANSVTIITKVRSKNFEYPAFVIFMGYIQNDGQTEAVLKIKSTNNIKYSNFTKDNTSDDFIMNHVFVQEEISGEQITDKEFICLKLNELLKRWIEKNNIRP